MKKLFTSVALALALMSASAENYTCPLAINISGSVDMPAGDVTVSVTKQDNGNTPWISKTLLWVTWELEIFILRT